MVIGLDGTVVNVAMPTLARDLGASSAQLQWIGGGYLLALSVAMLPVGLLGDRYGHKRLLVAGLALFGAASVLGSIVQTPAGVIAARTALGLAAAMIMPLSMAILPRVFGKDELPRAIAVWTAATAVGMPIGPIVGGWLLDHFAWPSVFLFNVPVVVVALIAVLALLPVDEQLTVERRPFDFLGTLQSALGITAIVYSTIRVPDHGWFDPSVLVPMAVGLALMVLFVRRQANFSDPLVDLALFRIPAFRWGSTLAVFVNFAVMGTLFVVPQYLAGGLGLGALGTGLGLLPLIGGLMVAATAAEPLVARAGERLVIPVGLALLGVGALIGASTDVSNGYGFAAVWLSIVGLGFGLAVVPATGLVFTVLPAEGTGRGTSLLESIQQLGAVLGVAGLGSLFSSGYASRLPDVADGFAHGMSLVLLVVAVVALAGAALAALRLPMPVACGVVTALPTVEQEEWAA
nr:MFS transporter [Aeromicrobium sp. Root236]